MKTAEMKALAAGIGLLLSLLGAVLIAWFDAFAKFDGQSHITIVPLGGIGSTHKTAAFEQWERKRERATRCGLALIAFGTAFGIFALPL